ncbi:Membrane protein involved in the export of O-antigen and teichoic acid [Sinorhizobium sp. NFACC03]|nr:Membrane protein involved in the export of O-antigen and teichoic acid [Sinorhizobium sp. NFACC03]
MAGNVVTSIIGLAAFALTARALGPSDYGILALCFTYTKAIERLVNFQSWQPLIKFGAEAQQSGQKTELRALFKFGLMLDVASAWAAWMLAIVLVLACGPLVGISSAMTNLVMFYCSVLPFQISGMPTAALRLHGNFLSIAYGEVISSLFRLGLCVTGFLIGGDLFTFILIWMAAQIANAIVLVMFSIVTLNREGLLAGLWKAPIIGIKARFPNIWRFAWSANLSLTIRSSAHDLDTLIVGFFAEPASAGLYQIAKRIGRIGQQAGVQVQAVLYPDLARSWAAGTSIDFRKSALEMRSILLGFGAILIVGLYLTITPVLRWTAGPAFVGAAPLVVVQAVAVAISLLGIVTRTALLAMGRDRDVLRSVLFSVVGFYVTAFSLIPAIGAMGANVAHIVLATIWVLSMTIAYRRDPPASA